MSQLRLPVRQHACMRIIMLPWLCPTSVPTVHAYGVSRTGFFFSFPSTSSQVASAIPDGTKASDWQRGTTFYLSA